MQAVSFANHLDSVPADRVNRQRRNASVAFANTWGRVHIRTTPHFVQAKTPPATAALHRIRVTGVSTKHAFLRAFMDECIDHGLHVKQRQNANGVVSITVKLPKRKRNPRPAF